MEVFEVMLNEVFQGFLLQQEVSILGILDRKRGIDPRMMDLGQYLLKNDIRYREV